jgi:hypothetical protein
MVGADGCVQGVTSLLKTLIRLMKPFEQLPKSVHRQTLRPTFVVNGIRTTVEQGLSREPLGGLDSFFRRTTNEKEN